MSSPPERLREPLRVVPGPDSPLELQIDVVASNAWPEVDRRSGIDRRGRPTGALDGLLRLGKRAIGRRHKERVGTYVDVYHRGDVVLVLSTFLLNILDAFLTLRWLQLGGVEGNPLMDGLLRSGDIVFLAQKCFVVGALLLVLIVHRNFGLARVGLWTLFGVYAVVLVYHLMLQLPILLS